MKKLIIYLTAFLVAIPIFGQESFTDERDGKVYRTVKIGNQTWMAENLAFLPQVDRVEEAQFEMGRFWVYGFRGNDVKAAQQTEMYKTYGVLYNWMAACNSCPRGWRLPTDAEWQELEKSLGMTADDAQKRLWRASGEVGTKLKSKEGWKKNAGTNTSGFNVLPGGLRGLNGFEATGYAAFFWTASPTNGDNGMRRSLLTDESGISRSEDRRYIGHSVRCIKN